MLSNWSDPQEADLRRKIFHSSAIGDVKENIFVVLSHSRYCHTSSPAFKFMVKNQLIIAMLRIVCQSMHAPLLIIAMHAARLHFLKIAPPNCVKWRERSTEKISQRKAVFVALLILYVINEIQHLLQHTRSILFSLVGKSSGRRRPTYESIPPSIMLMWAREKLGQRLNSFYMQCSIRVPADLCMAMVQSSREKPNGRSWGEWKTSFSHFEPIEKL